MWLLFSQSSAQCRQHKHKSTFMTRANWSKSEKGNCWGRKDCGNGVAGTSRSNWMGCGEHRHRERETTQSDRNIGLWQIVGNYREGMDKKQERKGEEGRRQAGKQGKGGLTLPSASWGCPFFLIITSPSTSERSKCLS